MADEPDFHPDVPTGNAIVPKTQEEAQSLARRMAGELPPNERRFHCITCGWGATLKFADAELEAIGGDISNYGGPCPGCDSMTLTLYDRLLGGDVTTINQRAKENRREEYKEQADVLVDRIKEEVGSVMSGSLFDGGAVDPKVSDTSGGTTAGERPEYPDAADVDLSNLKPKS